MLVVLAVWAHNPGMQKIEFMLAFGICFMLKIWRSSYIKCQTVIKYFWDLLCNLTSDKEVEVKQGLYGIQYYLRKFYVYLCCMDAHCTQVNVCSGRLIEIKKWKLNKVWTIAGSQLCNLKSDIWYKKKTYMIRSKGERAPINIIWTTNITSGATWWYTMAVIHISSWPKPLRIL